jgi:hypothetical protein
MRRVLAAVIAMGTLGAVSAHAGSLELRMGGFAPKAESLRFTDDEELFGTKKDDWSGFTGGLEYGWQPGGHSELGIHIDGFGRSFDTSYAHYHRQSGGPIQLNLELKTASLGMSYRYVFARRHARIKPYIGFGADVVFWQYTENGARIDFETGDIAEHDEAFADGATPALHGMAGIRLGLTPDIYLTAEARYLAAATDEMHDDFGLARGVPPNEINVSGGSATLGIMVRF